MYRVSTLLLAIATLSATDVSAQRAIPDTAALRRALAVVFDTTGDHNSLAEFARELPTLQAALVVLLNNGQSVGGVNKWLGTLPGFQGPHPGSSTTIGNAVFFRDLEKDAPSFYVAQLTPTRSDLLLAVVNYPWINGPSAIGVLRRTPTGWHRLGGLTSDNQLELYILNPATPFPTLAVFDRYWRADGSQGNLRFWQVREQALTPISDTLAQLEDAEFSCNDSDLTVTAAQFPEHLSYSTMGPRRLLKWRYRITETRIDSTSTDLSPWVSLVDRLYGALEAHDTIRVRHFLAHPDMLHLLVAHEPNVSDDTGSVELGRGEVQLSFSDAAGTDRYYRVQSERQPDGVWRIVRLVEGHWITDHLEWANGRRDKP